MSGSDFFLSRIPDPNCSHPEFEYFNPKTWFLSSRKYDPGCSSRIRILTFYPSRIQGSKRHRIPYTDPQQCKMWHYNAKTSRQIIAIGPRTFLQFMLLKKKIYRTVVENRIRIQRLRFDSYLLHKNIRLLLGRPKISTWNIPCRLGGGGGVSTDKRSFWTLFFFVKKPLTVRSYHCIYCCIQGYPVNLHTKTPSVFSCSQEGGVETVRIRYGCLIWFLRQGLNLWSSEYYTLLCLCLYTACAKLFSQSPSRVPFWIGLIQSVRQ